MPNFDENQSPTLRHIFALFRRGLIYAIVFFAVYAALFRVNYFASSNSSDSDEKLRQRQITQMNMYDEQSRKMFEMVAESERQQARMSAVISKQEEHAKRMDAVIERWEKQTGIRK